jgi:membrane-associated protein
MTEFFDFLESQFATHGYLIAFISLYLKGIIIVGTASPGASLLIVGAFMAAQGQLFLPFVILCGWLGMFLGSSTNYLIGRLGLWTLLEKTRLGKWAAPGVAEARRILDARGGLAIFGGQFTGTIRTFVSLVCGTVRLPYPKFALFNAAAIFCWVSAYSLLGFFLGGDVNSIEDFFKRLAYVVIAAAVIGYLVWRIRRRKPSAPEVPAPTDEQKVAN